MSLDTLYDKVYDLHKVATLPSGQDQLFISLHLIHEVTTPQAFLALKERQANVLIPKRTFATLDHIIPTASVQRPFSDPQGELMAKTLEDHVNEYGIEFFGPDTNKQGIVHVIGPEQGLTQPGMTVVCGDSHTSTHGAFGVIAFGIGTTQVGHVLETQTLAMDRLKVRQIYVDGTLNEGVYPKDLILAIINKLGVKGGLGYAYEYAGPVFDTMSMEGRMTVCNMSIEGGARIGYVNPDTTTYEYLKGRPFSPNKFKEAIAHWETFRSEKDAVYDDVITMNGADIEPMVTWGVTPAQSVGVSQSLPLLDHVAPNERELAKLAFTHMKLTEGAPIMGQSIDVGFIGSCTNSRLSDLRDAAAVIKGNRIDGNVKLIVVPGSQQVKQQAEQEGLDAIFTEAGAEWRNPGCSMCLAMNPDRLQGDQICASSSNRNFIGRQGSPTGRTMLMSPAMVAAAAVNGHVVDIRDWRA